MWLWHWEWQTIKVSVDNSHSPRKIISVVVCFWFLSKNFNWKQDRFKWHQEPLSIGNKFPIRRHKTHLHFFSRRISNYILFGFWLWNWLNWIEMNRTHAVVRGKCIFLKRRKIFVLFFSSFPVFSSVSLIFLSFDAFICGFTDVDIVFNINWLMFYKLHSHRLIRSEINTKHSPFQTNWHYCLLSIVQSNDFLVLVQ